MTECGTFLLSWPEGEHRMNFPTGGSPVGVWGATIAHFKGLRHGHSNLPNGRNVTFRLAPLSIAHNPVSGQLPVCRPTGPTVL